MLAQDWTRKKVKIVKENDCPGCVACKDRGNGFLSISTFVSNIFTRFAHVAHHLGWDVSKVIQWNGELIHGYEVVNLERIPLDRGALLVFYHGPMAYDGAVLANKLNQVLAERGQKPVAGVADLKFGFLWTKVVMEHVFAGPRSVVVDKLRQGRLVMISPGGTREAIFSSPQQYDIQWNGRLGYAKAAREARVPIIPVFCANIRQQHFSLNRGPVLRWLRPFYEAYRLPIAFYFGGFPVKLTSYVGEPVDWDAAPSDEELAALVEDRMQALIRDNQQLPASLWTAMRQRFAR